MPPVFVQKPWVDMQVGTSARNTEQVKKAVQFRADFVELRLETDQAFDFAGAKKTLSDAGIRCTVHLPGSPIWGPIDVRKEIVPYIDVGREVDADIVTFHTTLSPLFYGDEDIAEFLEAMPMASDAARESGVTLAAETLGLYSTELTLLFESDPSLGLAMDLGHAQILATKNRAFTIMEYFFDKIMMVNVHDNHGKAMTEEVLRLKGERDVPLEEMREIAQRYDTHLPIGEGTIDFKPIFKELKRHSYDGRFLMACRDQSSFPSERRKMMELWNES
jgi:sugar phosphate isomerase/epimerase